MGGRQLRENTTAQFALTWKVEGRVPHAGRGYLCVQERVAKAEKRMRFWVRLPSPFVVASESSATAALTIVELFQDVESASANAIIKTPTLDTTCESRTMICTGHQHRQGRFPSQIELLRDERTRRLS